MVILVFFIMDIVLNLCDKRSSEGFDGFSTLQRLVESSPRVDDRCHHQCPGIADLPILVTFVVKAFILLCVKAV